MRRLLACAGALLAVSAFGAETLVPVLVMPPVTTGAVPNGLPLVIQERANAHVLSAGKFSVVHARQLASMASRHRMPLESLIDPNMARSAAERLGVSLFVFSALKVEKDGYSLEITSAKVGDPETHTNTVKLPPGAAAAAIKAGQELALAAFTVGGLKVEQVSLGDAPSDEAMKSYAACAVLINRQPIGIENPTVLNDADLKQAISECGAASKASPKFAEAWAGAALANAIAGADDAAVAAIQSARALNRGYHLPNLVLARFWLSSRYQPSATAAALLNDAVTKEPGFLLARGYLGELDNTLGQHVEAAKVWKAYAALTPNAPFVISRLAYTLARMGEPADAATFAEKAVSFDRESLDLNLELASRYLDAGKVDRAIAVLEPLAKPADARAEAVLRLGFAYLVKGDLDAAEKHLTRAISLAKDPAEWRTRGRAKLNLAQVAFKRGKKDAAKTFVQDAAREGLTIVSTPENKDVVALVPAAELAKLRPAARGAVASALPVAGGDVDPSAARPAAPKGLEAALK